MMSVLFRNVHPRNIELGLAADVCNAGYGRSTLTYRRMSALSRSLFASGIGHMLDQ